MTQDNGFSELSWADILNETGAEKRARGLDSLDGQTVTLHSFVERNIGRQNRVHMVLEATARTEQGEEIEVRLPERPAERIRKIIEQRGNDESLAIRVRIEVGQRGAMFRAPEDAATDAGAAPRRARRQHVENDEAAA